jgi:dipeptidyl-peptidase-4
MVFWLCLLGALARPSEAQQKALTLDELYHPEKRTQWEITLPEIRWLADGKHYLQIRTDRRAKTSEWTKVEVASGREQPFYDPAKMEAALARIPGLAAEAAALARRETYPLNAQENAVLLDVADDLYYYELGSDRVHRLTSTPGVEREPRFSPDGRWVAFVRENDLYVLDRETRTERALTTDGGPKTLNGVLDWVYQEEIYGRGNFSGYWWSPDGTRLAFLQLDETPVAEFAVVDHIPHRQTVELTFYPKAGDPNPRVRLGIVDLPGGPPRWVDLYKYLNSEFLIVGVSWTPDSGKVVYQVQDREQTFLDLNLADPASGESKTLFRETTPAWVSVNGDPKWLKDGSFLWLSERSGFRHLYHYRADGSLLGPLTQGGWEVQTLHGVDEAAGLVYFSASERSPIGSDAYRVRVSGAELTRITERPGWHQLSFSPTHDYFIDRWSDLTTPPELRLHRARGEAVRALGENSLPALGEFRLARPELLQVKTRDGFEMEAFLLKPPDFDPSRKYPVWVHTYGGPQAPQVRNRWGGVSGYLWYQLLAGQGFIVWMCDNRTASGKGAESAWPLNRRFGQAELSDIEQGLEWLKKQPWVDGARIGIDGWSYGGFLTSYALTHSKSFAAGIAGGSVTDWRDYDTIYTERYLRTPQNNPEGYRDSSPVFAAKDLEGKLLLIHGTMDDNVHLQNTVRFAHELQKAGKTFELMLYPKSRHGVTDPVLVRHLRGVMLEFIVRTLGAPTRNEPTPP